MRRAAALIAVAACLGALALPAGAAGEPQLIELSEGRFPERSFVLKLPSGVDAGREQVIVTENGARVADLQVQPAREAGAGELGVVLVIDASGSMRGEPIRAAMSAARAFARRRSPEQQIAVVTFNQRPSILLPFTNDPATIRRALARPPALGRHTHVHDGTLAAIRLLQRSRVSAGSVIVLSDGADTGSRASVTQVAGAARAQGARIFTVGLESGAFDASSLKALAAGASGRYTSARSSADLRRIYDALAAELASEYLVRYRSLAAPGQRVDVFVRVQDIREAATATYRTPATAGPLHPPFERSFAEAFWRSPLSVVLIGLVGAVALGIAVLALLRPGDPRLRARLAAFVSAPSAEVAGRPATRLADQVLAGAERSLRRGGWWDRLNTYLEIGRIRIPLAQILLGTALVTLLVMWLLSAVGPVLVPLGLTVPLVVRAAVLHRVSAQRRLFGEQLAENLQVIASAMRAGHSLTSAMSVVVQEAAEPSKTEFQRVATDEQLGVPLEDALKVVGERMDNRDIEQIGLVAALQRETGGNTAEVLDRVGDTLRTRAELRRLVQTLTAQGRFGQWIVSLLPVILLAFITVALPGYMDPIWNTTEGNVVLALSAVMIVAGSLVIRKIVDIKV